MLTLPASVRILLATGPVDMRKSIDGLMALVRTAWGEDVYSGHLFAFVSRLRVPGQAEHRFRAKPSSDSGAR
ncbi:IS66 family insertion sequence element accessory protein TnpB [Myxococcaceae bacterium GXIMD 01537]